MVNINKMLFNVIVMRSALSILYCSGMLLLRCADDTVMFSMLVLSVQMVVPYDIEILMIVM